MYKYAHKHVELFKQIPFNRFPANVGFIDKVVNQPEKYATYENILKSYYFISEEIWDQKNIKPMIQYVYNDNNPYFCFYDFIKKRTETLRIKRCKPIKLFNAVLDKNGVNLHYKKCNGLIVKNKPNISKKEVYILRDFFTKFAYMYNQNYKFYKRNEYELPTEWAEHLYVILKELSEKADFFYKQHASFMLAQEMVSVLSNQSLFVYSNNLIKYSKQNRQKVMRQIREKKQFMFSEIKHDIERYKETKRNLKQQQNTR